MRVRLTYETIFEVTVDLDTEQVESITVLQGFHSPSGEAGYTHVQPIGQVVGGRAGKHEFTPAHTRRAIEIIKTTKHPKWQLRRVE